MVHVTLISMVPLICSPAAIRLLSPWHLDGFPLTLTTPSLRSEDTDVHSPSLSYHSLCTYIHLRLGKFWPGQLSRSSDSLRAGRSGDRMPLRTRFSSPVQTGPTAHPANYTLSTESLPAVIWPGRGVDHPPSSIPEVKERVELYLHSSLSVIRCT